MGTDNRSIIEAFITEVWSNGRLERIPELVHENDTAEAHVVGHDWIRETSRRSGAPISVRYSLSIACFGR